MKQEAGRPFEADVAKLFHVMVKSTPRDIIDKLHAATSRQWPIRQCVSLRFGVR